MRVLATVLSLSLVVTLLPADPALAEPEQDAVVLDEEEARAAAQQQALDRGEPVEVESLRSETSRTFANPDGTWTEELAAGPTRVLDEADRTDGPDGTWKEIDATLVEEDGVVQPAVAYGDLEFSAGGDDQLATLAGGDLSFGMRWMSALPEPELDGSIATYREVAPGIDLELEATATGFAKRVILNRRPPRAPVWRLPLHLAGMTIRQDTDGALQLQDANGETVAVADTALMWGSAIDEASGEPTHLATVDVKLVETKAGPVLEVRPDQAFLSDPGVQLPIVVDPATSLTAASDTWVQSSIANTSQWNSTELKAGTYNGGSVKARSLVKFNTSALAGKKIEAATVRLWNYHSYSCTARTVNIHRVTTNWSSSTVWSTQPSVASTVSGSVNKSLGYSSSCPDGWLDIPITSLVQAWANGTANYGLAVRAADETDSYGWKRFNSADAGSNRPTLNVTYNSYPKTPTSLSPAGSSKLKSTTPTLSGVYSDPDADKGRLQFQVYDNATGTLVASGLAGTIVTSGSRSSWVVPSGKLVTGKTYKWRARAYDGKLYSQAWTSYVTFTVDTTAPAAPAVSSSTHPTTSTWYSSNAPAVSWTAPSDASGIKGYSWLFDRASTTTPNTTSNGTATTAAATGLVDGEHWFHVRALDGAGNWGTARHFRIRVDATAPAAPTVTSATHPDPTKQYASDAPELDWTAADTSGITDYSWLLDGSATTTPDTVSEGPEPWADLEGLETGTWYFHVRARNGAGLWGAARHFKLQIADVAPPVDITSASHPDQRGWYDELDLAASWEPVTHANGIVGYAVAIDDDPYTEPEGATSTATSYTAQLAGEGTWWLHVRAKDGAGQWGATAHHRVNVGDGRLAAPSAPEAWHASVDADALTTPRGSEARLVLSTGALRWSTTDASMPGAGFDAAIVRSYDSTADVSGPLGPGWRTNLEEAAIALADGSVVHVDGDGLQHVFAPDGQGGFVAPAGVHDVLTGRPGDGFALTDPDQVVTTFDADGRVQSWQDANGNSRSLHYEDGRPTAICLDVDVCDAASAAVTIAYGTHGRISQIRDTAGRTDEYPDAGRTWTYSYDVAGFLTSVGAPGEASEPLVTHHRYDGEGRLSELVDAAGGTAAVWYDELGRVEAFVDPASHVEDGPPTEVAYLEDAVGDVVAVEVRSPQVVADAGDGDLYEVDQHGRLTAETDALGNTTSFAYDADHNVAAEVDPLGHRTTMTWEAGELVSEVDPSGGAIDYVYDEAGNLTSETDELGRTTTYAHDDAGNVLSETDPLGNTSTYTYDDAGNVLSETDPLGNTSTYTYDDAGNVVTQTDPRGNAAGADPAAFTTTFAYNADGEVIKEVDPLGQTTAYVYDTAGDLRRVVDPAGDAVSYEYDELGNVVVERDELGDAWVTTYDALGRPETEVDPLGNVETSVYDLDGNVDAVIDGAGSTTAYEYDDAGRLVSETDAEGIVTSYVYDDVDQLRQVIDPTGTTTMTYDEVGQLVAETDPLGSTTTYRYDDAGQVIAEIDSEGNQTAIAYDVAGNVASVQAPGGDVTSYEYDDAGQVTAVVDAAGNSTTMEYDEAGQLVRQRTDGSVAGSVEGSLADGGSRAIPLELSVGGLVHAAVAWTGDADLSLELRDASGTVVATGRRGGGDTAVVTYTAASPGPLSLVVSAAGGSATWRVDHTVPTVQTDTLAYDATGQITAHADASGTAELNYAVDGELEAFELPDGTVQTFEFDGGGQLLSIDDPTGGQQFDYDEAGRVTASTDQDATVTGFGYDDADNQVAVVREGVTTEFGYDAVGALASRTDDTTTEETQYVSEEGVFIDTVVHASGLVDDEDVDPLGQVTSTVLRPSATAAATLSWAYEYDGRGNLTAVTDTLTGSAVAGYGYDELDRLTSQTLPGAGGPATTTYSYDEVGNRVRVEGPDGVVDAVHNAAGQLVSRTTPAGVWSYFHDERGHLVRIVGPDGAVDRSFDADGRLVEIRGDGVATVSFTYDAAGLRTAKTVDTEVVRYGWDHGSGSGDPRLASLAVGDETAAFTYDPDGAPLTVSVGGRELVYRFDHRGSVIELADASDGSAVVSYRYDGWGQLLSVTGDAEVAGWNPYTFLGAYGVMDDPEVGLFQMGARHYDPQLGRFISPDPIGSDEHLSGYVYADNNPVVKFDPDGHMWGRIRKVGRAVAKGAKAAGRFAWKHKTDIALTAATFFPPTAAVAGAVRLARVGSMAYKGYKAYSVGRKVNTAVKAGKAASKGSRALKAGRGSRGAVKKASQSAGRGASKARNAARNGRTRVKQAVSRTRCRGNSFTPDTPVLMGDGTTVPIEQVEIGDEVWTTEGETGESSPQPVTDLIVGTGVKHLVDVTAGGQTIVATAGHPFWTADGGWTDAGDLQAGDQLRHPDGSTTVIEQVRHRADPNATVHNLTVDTTHTYYVGHDNGDTALLVHNTNCPIGNAAKGRRGEAHGTAAAGLPKNTRVLSINGRNRIPDIYMPNRRVGEFKNVMRQGHTKQIKDYQAIASREKTTLELWVNTRTRLSGPLKKQRDEGMIIIRRIRMRRGRG